MSDIPLDDRTDDLKNIRKQSKAKAMREQGFLLQGNQYKNTMMNVLKLLEKDGDLIEMFKYNQLLGQIEYNKTPKWDKNIEKNKSIDDGDGIFIKGLLAEKYQFEPNDKNIEQALFLYAKKNAYHPVKDYLESLKWDNVQRLNIWLAKIVDLKNTSYIECVGRKLICAMIKRIYEPGCQFDTMVVFEGKEGIYKTTMLKILGGEWYSSFSCRYFDKDAVDMLRGKWLLEFEELASLQKDDWDTIKGFISRTTDRARLAYRRNTADFKRQCVLVGTMNPIGDNQYFRDPGDNRRFWPIECGNNIDITWLKENRDQIFAEAMTLWKEERLDLDNNEAISTVIEAQQARKPHDAWIDIIDDSIGPREILTPVEVAILLGVQKDKINLSVLTRIGFCMRKLGWDAKRYGAKQKRVYVKPGTDINKFNQEIEARWDEDS